MSSKIGSQMAKLERAKVLRRRLDRHKLKFRKWARELSIIEAELNQERGQE